jgi:hypothetical protein
LSSRQLREIVDTEFLDVLGALISDTEGSDLSLSRLPGGRVHAEFVLESSSSVEAARAGAETISQAIVEVWKSTGRPGDAPPKFEVIIPWRPLPTNRILRLLKQLTKQRNLGGTHRRR